MTLTTQETEGCPRQYQAYKYIASKYPDEDAMPMRSVAWETPGADGAR